MCVRDRLNGLKESDPEGYKYVIGNIILAKTKLKEAGLYKKLGSDGATVFGGFGGVGVENWILQNGGSFSKAMETFLEASEKASTFAEFKEIYPIYDFGQNHMSREYSHDSFVKGLSESGFQETKKKFREFMQELTPVKSEQVSMQDLVKNALGSEAIRKSEVDKARQIERINQNEKEGVAIDE